MRIAFYTHYFPPEVNAPAARTFDNCRRWSQQGHEVTVLTCAPNMPRGVVYEGYRNRPLQRERIDGIDVLRVWTFIAANEGHALRILNYLSYLASAVLVSLCCTPRPDVVIATSPQFFCGWAGLVASRLRRRPFLLEIRDLWPESIVAVGAMRPGRVLRWLEWLERRMYGAADHIVTVGEGYRRRLLEKGVSADKISVVMNGVDRRLFAPRPPDLALKRELGLDQRFVCSYLGTIGMACGLEIVLRAAELFRARGRDDLAFLLVGDGAMRERLQAEARSRGLHNVVFAGRQDKQRMPAFLSISDACLVHLRRTELFRTVLPSKIFEAAGMARPIILGVEGDAADVVRSAGAGLCIEPENEHELAAAMERLAADPELGARLGRSGHDHVVRHFDRDRLAAAYLDIVAAVSRRGAGAAA
jgi:glycosyltransferase involved in cell wall biosynthesis